MDMEELKAVVVRRLSVLEKGALTAFTLLSRAAVLEQQAVAPRPSTSIPNSPDPLELPGYPALSADPNRAWGLAGGSTTARSSKISRSADRGGKVYLKPPATCGG